MRTTLARLRALEHPIGVGVIGIGSAGKGIVLQSHITPGIECVALADSAVDKATACAQWLKRDYAVVATAGAMHDAIRNGKLAVCEDGELVARCEAADAVIEASSSIGAAGRFGQIALAHGKHLIMMNGEADLIFGPYLAAKARENGVVYSSCDGDQPAVLRRMIDELQFWGLELVMAGNIKGYLDRYINPTTIKPEADKRRLDYRMCSSYTDGSKLNIEMALLANGLGLRTAARGMLGPRAKEVHAIFEVFDFDALWQTRQPVVDYVLGAEPAGGVFLIGYTNNEFQQFSLGWFPSRMGPGPFYVFYRPYHLVHFEAMLTVADAALNGAAVLQPDYGFQTNVSTFAKRDLRRGELLDGIGGYACYGLIENQEDNIAQPGLPICLADQVRLRRDIAKDEKILMADIDYNPGDSQFQMFARAVEQSDSIRASR